MKFAFFIFVAYYASLVIRYFGVAGGIYLWAKKNRGAYTQVRPGQIKSEIRHSLTSFVVFSIVGVVMILAIKNGYTQTYFDIADHGVPYLFVSFFVMFISHDIYFYFTHKWMHEVKWLRKFHRVHHESVHTTPLSSFSFHPVEAFIEIAFGIMFLFLIPLHPIPFAISQIVMISFNILGHAGFTVIPIRTRWISNGTVHSLHHLKSKGNYGLYSTFWDWLFKTQIQSTATPAHIRPVLPEFQHEKARLTF